MNSEIVDRNAWRNLVAEDPIEPDLPIIDAHHHIWPEPLFRGAEVWGAADLFSYKAGCGHNILATLFVEAGTRYRLDGPEEFAPVGETEFANAVGDEGERRGGTSKGSVAGIVAHANMMLGDAVEPVLQAHIQASSRMRGVRFILAHDADMPYALPIPAGLMAEPAFRAAFAHLARNGLSFDVWLMHPQMRELCDLADSFPNTTIVLDHVGTPMGIGRFAADAEANFAAWRSLIVDVARRPNVKVKLGGLNMPLTGLCVDSAAASPWTSQQMAHAQRRHILTAIEAFGPERCMFESNFPVDMALTSGTVLWNAFKRIVADFSRSEKLQMFGAVAAEVYRLPIPVT